MALYQEALGVERERLNVRQVAQLLRSMAFALSRRGEYARATELLEESLLVGRTMKSPGDVTAALRGLAKMGLHLRDYDRAQKLYDEALALGRSQGDRNAEAWALSVSARVARHRETSMEPRASSMRGSGSAGDRPASRNRLPATRIGARGALQGDLSEARRRYEEALRLLQDLGNRRRMAICLLGLAALDVREKAFERALVLGGAVDPMSEAGGSNSRPWTGRIPARCRRDPRPDD